MVGVPSIDGKQVSILEGKCSCSVLCPCAGCMVVRDNMGQPQEWLQEMLIANGKECVRTKDAARRVGALSIENTAAAWQEHTVGGSLDMNDAEKRRLNIECGSSFNVPVLAPHADK